MNQPNCRIIALANQKGGTGKTTTTVNLGVGLARQGKRVLLVDADPQGDLTTCLGWQKQDNLPATLATLMEQAIRDEPVDIQAALLHHREGVDLLPSNIELSAMEMALVTAMSREFALKEVQSQARNQYDLHPHRLYALSGHDHGQRLGCGGQRYQSRPGPVSSCQGHDPAAAHHRESETADQPQFAGGRRLLTLVDNRTNLARQTAETLRNNYGSVLRIYQSQIPLAVKAAEVSAAGKSIYDMIPTAKLPWPTSPSRRRC